MRGLAGRIQARAHGTWQTTKLFSRRVRAGRNRIELPTRHLDAGHYKLKLSAYDVQGRSDSAAARFSLSE